MSYICLMANENGAVAAGDSRETFHPKVHLDWRKKCFAIPERQLIWAGCGPTLRLGVDFLRGTDLILREDRPMEERLERIKRMVTTATRLSPWAGDPGPFCLLTAGVEDGHLIVRNCHVDQGQLHVQTIRPAPGEAVSLHAGAHRRKMPPLSKEGLKGLSYEALRDLAKERVRLAVRLDEERHVKDPDHNQTIGGGVRLAGLRFKQ